MINSTTHVLSISLVLFLQFGWITSAFSQTTVPPPKSRTSYWASSGTSLLAHQQKIPFVDQDVILKGLLDKEKIVFVDTRELFEFEKSHIPNAINIPFSKRKTLYSTLISDEQTTYVPYCNWDFRAYIVARELQEKGIKNIAMMYPHGLRSWISSTLPTAGQLEGMTDSEAWIRLIKKIQDTKQFQKVPQPTYSSDLPEVIQVDLSIYPKRIQPAYVNASMGDKLILNITAKQEEHWFVMPDFDVDLHLQKGESKRIELEIKKSGYFPFGCIHCCTQYQCKLKSAILADIENEY